MRSISTLLPLFLCLLRLHVVLGTGCDGGDRCSGHGTCRKLQSRHVTTHRCDCLDGWSGSDCSLQSCPRANVWGGASIATDDLHSREADCAGVGVCDKASGTCECEQWYEGEACELMKCPGGGTCSGNGRCLTIAEMGRGYDGFQLVSTATYGLWDADRVRGCLCEEGWGSYDCSERTCPLGSDPLLTNDPEVQTITCSGCFGNECGVETFAIKYGTKVTVDLNGESTATEVLEALVGLQTAPTITSVVFSNTTTACADSNTITVTFKTSQGNVPELEVETESDVMSFAVATVQDGTAERKVCSGRGTCTSGSGICSCDSGFGASDGDNGDGLLLDCGYWENSTTLACPASCSGHGTCSNSPNYTCTCYVGWKGASCADRSCPTGTAWFDEPLETDVAHQPATCSNRGTCDHSSGLCSCMAGFSGAACDRMTCSSRDDKECSGRGRCLSNRDFAVVGRFGGELAGNGKDEVQQIVCTATSGTVRFTFRYSSTGDLPYDSSEAVVRTALDALPSLEIVDVSFTSSQTTLCESSGANVITVTFPYDTGDLPLITSTSSSVTVTEVVQGSRISYGEITNNVPTWDADMIHSCFCDSYPDYNKTSTTEGDLGKWDGPACELRTCPWGHDVRLGQPLRYEVECSSSSALTLTFSSESASIASDATVGDVVDALAALSSVSSISTPTTTTVVFCNSTSAATSTYYINTELRADQVEALATTDASATITLVSDWIGVENQTLTCSASSGTFTLSFRGATTSSLSPTTTATELDTALEELVSIGLVTVSIASPSTTICNATSAAVTTISFLTELGDLPLLTATTTSLTPSSSLTIAEADKGLTINEECSGRGVCDRTLGVCDCSPPYVSSDGVGNKGTRGDCGAIDHFYFRDDANRTTNAAAAPARESRARKPFPVLLLFCIVGIILALAIGAVTISVPLLTLPKLEDDSGNGNGKKGGGETDASPSPSPNAIPVERLEADLLEGFASSTPQFLIVFQETLVFAADADGSGSASLYRFGNGSASEIGATPTSPKYMVEMGGELYFSGENAANGVELWKVASIWSTPELVEDINSGSDDSTPQYLTLASDGATLYFSADDGSGDGRELWRYTDGGSAALVFDIATGSTSSDPQHLAIYNTDLYFSANGNDGNGRELWVYDGVSNPILLADIASGSTSSTPNYLAVVDNLLYFGADGNNGFGRELWVYDGSSNPSRILDFATGTSHGNPRYLTPFRSTSLLFTATNDDGDDVVLQLNATNTTATLSTITFSSPSYFAAWRSRVFFSADGDDGAGTELWSAGW